MNNRIRINGVLYEAINQLNESYKNSFFVDLDDHSSRASKIARYFGLEGYWFYKVCGRSPRAWSTVDYDIAVYIVYCPVDNYEEDDGGHVEVAMCMNMTRTVSRQFSPNDKRSWALFNRVTKILSDAVERDDDESWDDIERAWNLISR